MTKTRITRPDATTMGRVLSDARRERAAVMRNGFRRLGTVIRSR